MLRTLENNKRNLAKIFKRDVLRKCDEIMINAYKHIIEQIELRYDTEWSKDDHRK